MKNLFPIIIALVVAVMASVGIVQYNRNEQSSSLTQVEYVVAAKDLPKGGILKEGSVEIRKFMVPTQTAEGAGNWNLMSRELIEPQNKSMLLDQVLLVDVAAGQPIAQTMLASSQGTIPTRDWKEGLTTGKRAISIPAEGVSAVSGLINVGDRVDILVTMDVPDETATHQAGIQAPSRISEIPEAPISQVKPMTFYLMENVQLLAIGQDSRQLARKGTSQTATSPVLLGAAGNRGGSITIAVTPEQATNIAFAVSERSARFTLTLRRLDDPSEAPHTPGSFDAFVKMFKQPTAGVSQEQSASPAVTKR
ncbi:TPA: Flp pilus assembly protein CpaB [Candidatus Sumerlaeota bacterium]|jgi:Flp pilus assembly protein CpaB|nr:Flp pilus assembly protein CpaB [Candidatus Sumerlaeota bacterium]